MRARRWVVSAVALLALSACTASSADVVQPREGRSGLQGTGTLDERQVVVAQGLPELVVGDCDPTDDPDADVCFISDTIDGRTFVLTIENPQALVEGRTLPVVAGACTTPAACDAVTGAAIVSLKLGTDPAVRATEGTLTMSRVEPFANYAGEVSLRLPNGRFSGSFDVVPRPD